MVNKAWAAIAAKIDYEGGLAEYLLSYGGEMPEEFQEEVQDFIDAYHNLITKMEELNFPDASEYSEEDEEEE